MIDVKLDTDIKRELKERSSQIGLDHLLTRLQYELLRRRGMTATEVVAFEKTLRKEIKEQRKTHPLFIDSAWVELRVDGREPNQIEYDMVNAVR